MPVRHKKSGSRLPESPWLLLIYYIWDLGVAYYVSLRLSSVKTQIENKKTLKRKLMMDSIVITVSSTAILFSALAIITNSWLLFSIFVWDFAFLNSFNRIIFNFQISKVEKILKFGTFLCKVCSWHSLWFCRFVHCTNSYESC